MPPAAHSAVASRYPAGALHGPMTVAVIDRNLAVLDRSAQRRDVFLKTGSSETVNTRFLRCFASATVHPSLEPTRSWFARTPVDGATNSFDRQSLAAGTGWWTSRPLEGSPTPLAQELAALRPGFAVVLMGTEETAPDRVHAFERSLRRLIDALLAAGVVPTVSTIPPRNDSVTADALVPEMNAVIRALAQARQVPFVDLWQVLLPLPSRGLLSDGVHLNVYSPGACRLDGDGASFGMNQRNRVTLESLDRTRRFLLVGETPEAEPPPLSGTGTWEDPRTIDRLPFVDDGDTRTGVSVAGRYGTFPQDESGPEIVYRVDVPAPARIRARVFGDDGVDADLHWMDAPDPARTIARADRTLDVSPAPGTYWLSVDTFVSAGVPRAGPYRLTVVSRT